MIFKKISFIEKDDQSSAYDKRMRLDYDEIPNYKDATQLWDATKTWDDLLLRDQRQNCPFSYNQLLKAVNLGNGLLISIF